jgi:DNA-binding protein WhiA
MSFSYKVKKELSSLKLGSNNELMAELYAVILFSGNIGVNDFTLSFENRFVADRIWELLQQVSAFANFSVRYFTDQKSYSRCLHKVEIVNIKNLFENYHGFQKDFLPDFLRGVFILCGSISNPRAEYHLEFNVSTQKLCDNLIRVFKSCGPLNFNPGITQRRNSYVVYLKGNEKITDFLVLIGAKHTAMELIQIKMIKEVRNNINRTTNFETANISKTTSSAAKQIKAIKKIKSSHGGLESLPECLEETARLRLGHPYLPLGELAKLYKDDVSKSGVNHRLKKLIKIADEYSD